MISKVNQTNRYIAYLLFFQLFFSGTVSSQSCNDWNKMQNNLTKDIVESILGPPNSYKRWSGQTTWRYRNGKVTFGTDGRVWSFYGPNCRHKSNRNSSNSSYSGKSKIRKWWSKISPMARIFWKVHICLFLFFIVTGQPLFALKYITLGTLVILTVYFCIKGAFILWGINEVNYALNLSSFQKEFIWTG